jgi:hypothetical protein
MRLQDLAQSSSNGGSGVTRGVTKVFCKPGNGTPKSSTFARFDDTKGQCFQRVAKIIMLDKGVSCANIKQTTGRWHAWSCILKANNDTGDGR